ncbi:MAG: hypothetical protein ACFFD3_04585 [Candidatus Thorarchaeota archaeon]
MKARGMFRIYQCRRCRNSGFAAVNNEEDDARCSLCNGLILHEKGTLYAATIDEAKDILTDLVLTSRLDERKTGASRGLGLKKRVLNIIEALIEINRGQPASYTEVLRECSEAGIDLERARHFVDVLKREGALVEHSGNLFIIEGGSLG